MRAEGIQGGRHGRRRRRQRAAAAGEGGAGGAGARARRLAARPLQLEASTTAVASSGLFRSVDLGSTDVQTMGAAVVGTQDPFGADPQFHDFGMPPMGHEMAVSPVPFVDANARASPSEDVSFMEGVGPA